MARPKGSKNKARTVKASVDYVAVIAEKAAKKEKIESEVASSSFIPGILSISAEVRCHIRWYGVVSLAALNF